MYRALRIGYGCYTIRNTIQYHTTRLCQANRALTKCLRLNGTHEADLPGMPATGKYTMTRGTSTVELREGKIKRDSIYEAIIVLTLYCYTLDNNHGVA